MAIVPLGELFGGRSISFRTSTYHLRSQTVNWGCDEKDVSDSLFGWTGKFGACR